MMRIGELAKASGVSAKALRLYESRRLLRPCAHSAVGYRLYGEASLRRLQQILVLRRAGFALAEIGPLLDAAGNTAEQLIDQRIVRLQGELAQQQRSLQTLLQLRTRLHSASSLVQLLECINMSQELEVNLTTEERAAFKQRAEALGSATIKQAEMEWPQLIAGVRAAMDAGTPPTDPAVITMAQRWQQLVQMATGGDAGVERKIATAWQAQPQQMSAMGMDPAMFAYVGAAMAAGKAAGQ
jgi:DNA-binding transcriptional MerR regulator